MKKEWQLEKHYLATINNNSGKKHQWMLELVNKNLMRGYLLSVKVSPLKIILIIRE